ncbi:aliphatic sulfonate ABC transporter substrate-binding protein [Streptomyces yunnanensis]|uniref:Aliphatic sulfonate ABC transporter substrate-binding protein n=1 Tax=Streptomyces yunnanensis TaxID=156453 RepID=A0A9X8N7L0_9ACTN|nr:aliphatic sulfonate ABC transporter substrate-binding protein [Streptomyces yunnanensis]WEB39829.1 aliphatic sulfonate ABC transporter substrate-binding protein [Streptomyces yunnanensis]SHN22867.1 NitT/TauT family transport system substrate-binding protein [Streptomyces yunnanensis]
MSAVRHRLLAVAATVPLLTLALGACGYGSQAPKDTAATVAPKGPKVDGLDQVKIGFFGNTTHATPLIGLQTGQFQKELGGTAVKSSVFNAGPAEIEALNSNAIDIGWIGPSPAINGYVKSHGKSLKIIAGSASGGVSLIVNPKKIKSLDDLKGKTIATPQLGNTQDVALLNFLSGKGYTVDATTGKGDVTVQRIDNKVTPTAFTQGSIDAAWVPEPTASKLVAAGGKALLDEKKLWQDGKFVITNVIVSQRFLKEHPKAVEAVLRASVKTNAWIRSHPAEAVKALNEKLADPAITGKPLPDDVIDPAFKNVDVTDDPLAATLQEEADHAVKAGLLKKPDLKGIYDLTLLNKVLKSEGKPPVDDAGLGGN